MKLLPPANEVCEGYVFTGVCLSTGGEGECVVALGGCVVAPGVHAWLLWGGMRGCSLGVCVVAPGGHTWLLRGGMHGCSLGGVCGCSRWACVVAPRGVCGCSGGACVVAPGGMRGCSWGACVVAPGGHAWLLGGGRAWFFR